MTLGWIIFGTIAQLMLGFFLFMLVVFSAAGIGNGGHLDRFQLTLLNLSMIVLPAVCILSAGVVLYLYKHGGSALSYWWYALPLAVTSLYLVYAISLSRQS